MESQGWINFVASLITPKITISKAGINSQHKKTWIIGDQSWQSDGLILPNFKILEILFRNNK